MDFSTARLSRRALLRAAASAAMLAGGLPAAWGRRPPESAALFQNPLFGGDYPDPAVLRVGGDFYITHSSSHYAPGLVVWHSRDLVNWTHLSNGLDHYYGEVWAPDLVEHQGQYYIYFPLEGRLTVVHAASPRGPWSAPIDLGVKNIDPGHVVGPDGSRYLYSSGGHVVPLSADGLSVTGPQRQVYDGWQFPQDWKTEGTWLEGPKLMRRGDWYYLTSAEGGTSGPPTSHMAVVARAPSPLGPWENSPHNPLIHTYSAGEAWSSVGHGTLISTPDDRWYIVYHGYRKGFQTLGRNTMLEPVEWTADGWPAAPLGTRRAGPMPAPLGIAQRPMISLSDDFRAPALKATWAAWNEADMSRFEAGGGTLTIRAKGDTPGQSSPLTVKARDESYAVQVAADMSQPECGAALGLFYSTDNWIFAEIKGGQLRVYQPKQTLTSRAWTASRAQLKIVNRRNQVDFLVSSSGSDWQTLITGFDASGFTNNALHDYQQLHPALAATGTGTARFADFSYRVL